MNVALWIIQILLAALFLFAGGTKLVLPLDQLAGPVPIPAVQPPKAEVGSVCWSASPATTSVPPRARLRPIRRSSSGANS